MLIGLGVALDQPLSPRESFDLLNCIDQVSDADPSPRRSIPNQIHEGMGLIEDLPKPMFTKSAPQEGDSLKGFGSLIRREVRLLRFARDRRDQAVPAGIFVKKGLVPSVEVFGLRSPIGS